MQRIFNNPAHLLPTIRLTGLVRAFLGIAARKS